MKCIRIYRAELRQDRAAYLAFKAAEQGDTTKHDRYKRYAARLGRVLGDGGDPWREGPREGAIRRLEAKRKAREGVEA